ncbi:hypothetical protein Q0Z83_036180 [Actinoplanes sichuanensis]|nr:hypothetical protein Q0Z83_036180 [Actinoplanes sichuanensis]
MASPGRGACAASSQALAASAETGPDAGEETTAEAGTETGTGAVGAGDAVVQAETDSRNIMAGRVFERRIRTA